jgi:hypothetical protein
VNDAVIFRSSTFSLEPPVEHGVAYDLPLGDDIAAFLAPRISSADPSSTVGSPIREDWGSVLDVSIGTEAYSLSFHWLGYRDSEDTWGIQFAQRIGCLGILFGRRSRSSACRPLQSLVARIITESPEAFTHVEWLSQQDFHARQR